MKTDNKLFRIVFVSPWPLLVFLVIPLFFILSLKLHIRLPFTGSKNLLLLNNACFTLAVAIRFLTYLLWVGKGIRYGSARGIPRNSTEVGDSLGKVRDKLTAAGYLFDSGGAYGEKRDAGYLGTTVLYAGLVIVLFTGTLDNVRQFSGTLLGGVGASVDLNDLAKYRKLITGPLTGKPTTLPKMKVLRQILPDSANPRGGSEAAFFFPGGDERTAILKSTAPFRAGAYDITMSKMFYEPIILILIDGSNMVFKGPVILQQLQSKVDDFSFYGDFGGAAITGEIYYQPEKSRLRVIMRQGRQTMLNKEMIFQQDRQVSSGNLMFTCEKMGVWSEIHVVRRRHMNVIALGGIVAFIGLVMRIAIRPRRVWLEEAAAGCRVKVVGRDAERLLG